MNSEGFLICRIECVRVEMNSMVNIVEIQPNIEAAMISVIMMIEGNTIQSKQKKVSTKIKRDVSPRVLFLLQLCVCVSINSNDLL